MMFMYVWVKGYPQEMLATEHDFYFDAAGFMVAALTYIY